MNTRIQILVLSTLVMLMSQSVSPSASSSADDALFELVLGRKDADGRDFPHLLDPPLWKATTYLLEGESHSQMLALLDRMLDEPPGNMEHTRRALTQHLLWQVFDWSAEVEQPYGPERVLLRRKLADVIRHLALTTNEIKALPPALPAGRATPGNVPNDHAFDQQPPPVLDPESRWLSLGMVGGAVADAHVRASTGRSVFGVFLFVPEGRAAAINYLTSLKKVSFPLDRTERGPNFIRSETLPVMPAGTRFALLRQMILINDRGEPVASPIIQSVQLRTLIKGEEPAQVDHIRNEKFVLDRQRYLRGDPAVFRCIDDQAREPQVFFPTHGDDQFAPRTDGPPRTHHVVMTGCAGCHRDAGTASLHTFTRLFSESNASRNPSLQPLSFEREFSITRGFKQGHATWGLLRGYWEARAMTP